MSTHRLVNIGLTAVAVALLLTLDWQERVRRADQDEVLADRMRVLAQSEAADRTAAEASQAAIVRDLTAVDAKLAAAETQLQRAHDRVDNLERQLLLMRGGQRTPAFAHGRAFGK